MGREPNEAPRNRARKEGVRWAAATPKATPEIMTVTDERI
jgi:hypothetical protein